MNQPLPAALVSIVMWAGDVSSPMMLPDRSAMLKVVACNAASWLVEAPADAQSAIAAATTESSSAWLSCISPGVGVDACTPPGAASSG
jgi:hypothetical protein